MNMASRIIKKYLRKRLHIHYVQNYICEIRWEIVNAIVTWGSPKTSPYNDVQLKNMGNLIRKYERRLRLLKMR